VTEETKDGKEIDPELDTGWDFEDEDEDGGPSGRPTLAPPFDLATYAKEAMTPSADGRGPGPASAPVSSGVSGLHAHEGGAQDAGAPIVPNRILSLPPPPPLPGRSAFPRALVPGSSPADAAPPSPNALELDFSDANPITRPPPAVPRHEPTTIAGLAALSTIMTPLPPSSGPASQRITPREMQRIEDEFLASRKHAAAAADLGDAGDVDNLLALANHRAPLLTPMRVPSVAAPASTRPALPSDKPSGPDAAAAPDPIVEMQERFALGDYSGALVMAESMLDENPTHVEAREYAESCRSVLQQMYTARIGPLDHVPVVEVAPDQLRWLSIDHRTGFILSLVDGVSSLEMILDVSGMPPLDALRMLFELVQQRIISVRDD
jgi:hypothetical protein